MKRMFVAAAVTAATAATLSFPALASASTWDLDGAHTTAAFSVTHMMLTTVRGDFQKTTGTVELDEKDVTKSKVEATIDASTVDTRVADRDKHLRSQDFFWVEKYPTITFKSTKVEKAGEGKLRVRGDLTIRGVTKPIVLDVTGPSKEITSPWGTPVRSLHATTKIKRSEFGLTWNKALESGGVLVGDEVTIDIDAELNPHVTKKAEAASATSGR